MWKGPKEFFTYNKKQRNGLLALLAVALLLQAFLYFDDFFDFSEPEDFSEFIKYAKEYERQDSLARLEDEPQYRLFSFDPNTASDSALRTLGFSPKLASTIINYRSKGGQFRRPQDLAKIYGMDSALYNKVSPYVSIAFAEKEEKKKEDPFNFKKFDLNKVTAVELEKMGLYGWQAKRVITFREKVRPYQNPKELYEVYHLDTFIIEKMLPFASVDTAAIASPAKEVEEKVMVEINSADSLQLLKLPGVGPFYAKMILKHRARLGGFYSKEQLLEVYKMDVERLGQFEEQVLIDSSAVRKINVNTATFKELVHHPYLEYELVKNIVNFREDVRPFRSIDELKHIELMDEQLFSKIAPYLTITEETSQ